MKIAPSSPRKRVALLVYTSFEPGRETLRGIGKFAHEIDSWRLLHVPGNYNDPIPKWLHESEVDGIIARVSDVTMARALSALKLPIVDANRAVGNVNIPQVDADDERISALVAEHFFNRGFAHLAFYPHANECEGWSQRRCKFLRCLCAGRATFHVYHGRDDHQEGTKSARDDVRAWVRNLPKPIGIMLARDDGGFVVLDACREENLLVPEQVAVVGVDNDQPLCDLVTPPLSSVRLDHLEVGYQAARLLDQLMSGTKPPCDPLLVSPVEIVTRRSSDTHAISDTAVALGVHLIHENLANSKLTNDDLAHAAGMSRSLFQRRFRKETGKSIHDYLIEARLKKAKALLKNSNLGLAEISNLVGFGRQGYMGYVFKSQLGITPASYRTS
ncbi:MAG: LacI family transcriptional regulator [Verrucomicrobiales bacterium]|jgi:LacI family transcriptional regulator